MRKLDTSRTLKSRFGPITATHEIHEFHVYYDQIVSAKKLATEQEGEIIPIEDVADSVEKVVITGDALKALGHDFKVSDVLKAHEKIISAEATQREKEIHQRNQALEQQIKDTKTRLKELESQKGS